MLMKAIQKNLRVGVVGVGTMGQHHVRIISQTPDVSLAGFYDPDRLRAQEICGRHGCECFATLDKLLDESDAVTVAAPTSLHFETGEKCLNRGLHVLMEKPLAHELEAAARLVVLSQKTGLVLMVGHVERYNPVVGKLIDLLRGEQEEIISIDAHRLAPFDGSRCLDVDVLYDLLIHDIDLALEIAGSSILSVSAVGRPVFSQKTDVAHTRIEFQGQVTAAFCTAKCSPRKVRTLTVTTPRRALVADTLSRTLTLYTRGRTLHHRKRRMRDGKPFRTTCRFRRFPITRSTVVMRVLPRYTVRVHDNVSLTRARRGVVTVNVGPFGVSIWQCGMVGYTQHLFSARRPAKR